MLEIKQIMFDNFPILLNAYKILSGYDAHKTDNFCITWLTFSDILKKCPNLIDNKLLNFTKVDIEFKKTNVEKVEMENNPDAAMIR